MKLARSVHLLVLVGLVALVVGFAGTGTARAQGGKNSFEFKNGTTMADPHRAYICRGTRVAGVEKIDARASETLILHGDPGAPGPRGRAADRVEVKVLDGTGVVRFADAENPVMLTFKKFQLEILLRSDTTGDVFQDATIQITWFPGVGPTSTVYADGALAFVLADRTILADSNSPTARAVSPPPNPGDDTGTATCLFHYQLSISSVPMSDLLLGDRVVGTVGMRGKIACGWTVLFAAPSGADKANFWRDGGIQSDDLPDLARVLFRKDSSPPVKSHGNVADTETGELKPIQGDRLAVDEDFQIEPIGFGAKAFELRIDLNVHVAGNAVAKLSAASSANEPFAVFVTPICPF